MRTDCLRFINKSVCTDREIWVVSNRTFHSKRIKKEEMFGMNDNLPKTKRKQISIFLALAFSVRFFEWGFG